LHRVATGLRGFGKGQTVRAPLRNLTVCLNDVESSNVREIPIVCAVTDLGSADYDVILPVDVVRSLQVAGSSRYNWYIWVCYE